MVLNNFNPILTAMSLMISIISAWTALDMASRVTKSQGIAARLWLIGGGLRWEPVCGLCILLACRQWFQ